MRNFFSRLCSSYIVAFLKEATKKAAGDIAAISLIFSFIVAGIYALYPDQSEFVLWVSGMPYIVSIVVIFVLATIIYFVAKLLYLKSKGRVEKSIEDRIATIEQRSTNMEIAFDDLAQAVNKIANEVNEYKNKKGKEVIEK